MNARYIVEVNQNNRTRKLFWNGSRVLKLDSNLLLEPVLELNQNKATSARLRKIADANQVGVINQGTSMIISQDEIRGAVGKSVGNSSVMIRETHALSAPYATQSSRTSVEGIPYCFACTGNWVSESRAIGQNYTTMFEGEQAFQIAAAGDKFAITNLNANLEAVGPASQRLESLSQSDLLSTTIRHKTTPMLSWRFGMGNPSALGGLEARDDQSGNLTDKKLDSTFNRSLVVSALLLLLLIYSIPKFEEVKKPLGEEAIIPPQFAKVLLRPRGDAAESPTKASQKAIGLSDGAPKAGASVGGAAGAGNHAVPRKLIGKVKRLESLINGLVTDGISSGMSAAQKAGKGSSDHGQFLGRLSDSMTGPGGPGRGTQGALAVGNLRVSGSGGGGGKDGVGYGSGAKAGVAGQGTGFLRDLGDEPTVDEGLTKAEVGAIIHKHRNEVRYCYSAAAIRQPGLEERLPILFKISPEGRVVSSSAKPIGDSNKDLETCLISRLNTWQFPKPRGNKSVDVNYPFNFKVLGKEET